MMQIKLVVSLLFLILTSNMTYITDYCIQVHLSVHKHCTFQSFPNSLGSAATSPSRIIKSLLASPS